MADSRLLKWGGGVLTALVVVALIVALTVYLVKRSDDDDSSSSSSSSDAIGSRVTDSLKFLVLMSRHGNRGSTQDYPNDPYPLADLTYWPYGEDRLTPHGRTQMYNLGVRVRALYNGFLNSTFNPEELHASSTYMDRMLISGEAFLAGLYPPSGWQVFESNLAWQPTPIYSDSPDKTVVINSCQRYLSSYMTTMKTFLVTYATNISSLVSTYDNITGSTTTSEDPLWYFWDKLLGESTEGYTIPSWADVMFPQPLQNLMAAQYMATFAGNEEIVRLLVGNLFEEILGVLNSVVNGTLTERKIQYYSAHDSSIVAMQGVFGVPSESMVGMVKAGSGLTLELHQNQTTNDYYLQVLFIDGGTTDLDLSVISTPSCGDPYCDLNTLINNTVQFMGVDFDEECLTTGSVLSDKHNFPYRLFN